eukprot:6180005-Pleurochrysis_carterae.AAC.2
MGKAIAATAVQLVPCRRWASRRGRCADVRLLRRWRSRGERGSTQPRPLAVRPASKPRRSPSGAFACRWQQRELRARVGTLAEEWRRTSDRSRRPAPARSLARTALL